MANTGPDTNTAHFSILMAPAAHLDGHYVVFGEILSGFDVSPAMRTTLMPRHHNKAFEHSLYKGVWRGREWVTG